MPQSRNPANARIGFKLLNLSLGEHATIPDQDNFGKPKLGLKLRGLVGHRGGVGGIPWVNLDANWAPLAIGEQTVNDNG